MSRPALPPERGRTALGPADASASGPPPAAARPCLPAGAAAGPADQPGDEGRRRGLRVLAGPAVSVLVYFAVRPAAGSDAAGLAIAGVVPVAYAIVGALVRRRVEIWAAATAVGYAFGCLASLLAGGSSLPLKLHEAAVTFLLGVILLGAVLVRRPLPVGRVLKVPRAGRAGPARRAGGTGLMPGGGTT